MGIENLVFQGGGAKGLAYVGAVGVLERRGIMPGVRRVAGASAGAITAAFLSVGTTSEDLRQILAGTAFTTFEDGGGWLVGDGIRIVRRYGIFKGDAFAAWMRAQLGAATARATGSAQPDITLAGVAALARERPDRFRDLYVVASNLTKQVPEVFSAETRPALEVWRAGSTARTAKPMPVTPTPI